MMFYSGSKKLMGLPLLPEEENLNQITDKKIQNQRVPGAIPHLNLRLLTSLEEIAQLPD